jgi:hypothetical protein
MPIDPYRNFVIYVKIEEEAGVAEKGQPREFSVRVFDSPTGEGEKEEKVPVQDWEQLETWRRELADRRIRDDDLITFACRLGDMIMPPYARSLYRASRNQLPERDRLRLRLRLPPELAIWPWEYAIVQLSEGEPTKLDHLVLDPKISVVRHVEIAVPAASFRTGDKRRVLVAMASPRPHTSYRKLKLDEEQKQIKIALQEIVGVEAVYIPDFDTKKRNWGATEEQIRQALQQSPTDLFHFSGHGEFTREQGPQPQTIQGKGAIILAKSGGLGESISAERLSSLLIEGQVRVVVLGACETAEGDVFHKWSSVAMCLLKSGIPAVIAMQFTIYDDLARVFAAAFYHTLVARTLDEAVLQGRLAMWRQGERDRDWGAPVLFLRNSGGAIFKPVLDTKACESAETITRQTSALNNALMRWVRREALATTEQLQSIEQAGLALQLTQLDKLLLLRSALAQQTPTHSWVTRFGAEDQRLFAAFDKSGDAPDDSEETLDSKVTKDVAHLLGVNDPELSERPAGIGAVSWSAANHPDLLTRQTAALALLALGEQESVNRISNAVRHTKNGAIRRQRRAELLGTLCDVNNATEQAVKQQMDDNLFTYCSVWCWRVRRRWQADRRYIGRAAIRGALGAALALGLYRGLVAIPLNSEFFLRSFAIYSYFGFILGLGLMFGTLVGPILLLQPVSQPASNRRRKAACLSALLAAIGFALASFLVSILNSTMLLSMFLRAPPAFIVGAGLAAGLYDQPRAGIRLGISGWGIRLLIAAFFAALAQSPSLYQEAFPSALIPPRWLENATILDAARSPSEWRASAAILDSQELRNGLCYCSVETFRERLFYCRVVGRLFARCNPEIDPQRCCDACPEKPFSHGTIWNDLLDCWSHILSMLDAALYGLVLTLGSTVGLHWSSLSRQDLSLS